MSTEASTYNFIPEQSDDFATDEPWSIEKYADGLMDELFADLDRAVDGVRKQPVTTIEPEYVRMSKVKLPATGISQPEVRPVRVPEQDAQPYKNPASAIPTTRKTAVKVRSKSPNWFGRVAAWGAMVGIAVAGIMVVQNVGLLNRLTWRSLQLSIQPNLTDGQVAPNQDDLRANLADYMLSAMAIIERQQTQVAAQSGVIAGNSQQPVAMANGSGVTLPPPANANNRVPASNGSTTVVERIYIPVHRAPLPMHYAPPAIPGTGVNSPLPQIPKDAVSGDRAGKPTVKSSTVAKKQTSPAPTALKPMKVQDKPVTISQPKLPPMPIAKFQAAPPQLPAAKPATTEKKVAVAPVSANIILEGLLELGEKSAALFKVSGITRRIEIGESISSTGWTLVEVANGKALIRRNGEVRSIYAGQKF